MNKNIITCLLAALALRWTCAVVTEFNPIFPSYYYVDARLYDRDARELNQAWKTGHQAPHVYSPGKEFYTFWSAFIYRVAGPHALLLKLINGLAGTLSLILWFWILAPLFGQRAGLTAIWILALWPSHVFFTSQNFKEAGIVFMLPAVCLPYLQLWQEKIDSLPWQRCAAFALSSAAFFFLGLLRPHILLVLASAILVGGLISLPATRRDPKAFTVRVVACAWLLATVSIYRPISIYALERLAAQDADKRGAFVPGVAFEETPQQRAYPYSPRGLSEFRRIRSLVGQQWSKKNVGREIETQLFPNAQFNTWWDVAAFIPKAGFYALFMPLPGLYSTGGKLGRKLGAMENCALLALFLLALVTLARMRLGAGQWTLISFFLLTLPPTALLEFDLGSAARHRLVYFPFIFPFAAAQIHAWRAKRGGAPAEANS